MIEGGKNPQKYIRYTAEDLDRMLSEFFEGENWGIAEAIRRYRMNGIALLQKNYRCGLSLIRFMFILNGQPCSGSVLRSHIRKIRSTRVENYGPVTLWKIIFSYVCNCICSDFE